MKHKLPASSKAARRAERNARLAQALRNNLHRRKAAVRAAASSPAKNNR